MWSVHMLNASRQKDYKTEVYVVKGLDLALVGLPTIEALSLVTKVHIVSTSKVTIPSKFLKLIS